MSLMLNALKRIEAKQAPSPTREAAGPARSRDRLAETLPPTIADPPSCRPIDFRPRFRPSAAGHTPEELAPPEPVSLEAAMDQLQAFVAEAGLLRRPRAEVRVPERAESPVVVPVASDPYRRRPNRFSGSCPGGVRKCCCSPVRPMARARR